MSARNAEYVRVPMNVRPEVRDRLQRTLFHPELHGVGYSEFLAAALDAFDRGEWVVHIDGTGS